METAKKHGLVARIFHWGFILVFIYALFKQLDNIDQLSEPGLLRFEVIFAAAFLVLLAARYTYMRVTMPSALPEETSVWMKRAARAGHLAMYISLSMIAISGLLIGALYYMGGPDAVGMGIAMFLHENSVLAAYASIALHVAAALFHRLKGDGIWSSMVPVMTEDKARSE
ncbi:MAG: cytochrome b/b6 domain-containing protein [Rhodobacteraceae bacterium]|nr:cytochrome b/b6 domain-containing protein [Paracoccaceae bacterium]